MTKNKVVYYLEDIIAETAEITGYDKSQVEEVYRHLIKGLEKEVDHPDRYCIRFPRIGNYTISGRYIQNGLSKKSFKGPMISIMKNKLNNIHAHDDSMDKSGKGFSLHRIIPIERKMYELLPESEVFPQPPSYYGYNKSRRRIIKQVEEIQNG